MADGAPSCRRCNGPWPASAFSDPGGSRRTGSGSPRCPNHCFRVFECFIRSRVPARAGHHRTVRLPWKFHPRWTSFRIGCPDTEETVLAVLGKRLARFGLRLHAEKTRFVDVRSKRLPDPGAGAAFDFLGFTQIWVRSNRKYAVLRPRTAKGRLARAVLAVREGGRRHRHAPLPYPRNDLARGLQGHYADYGRSGNRARSARFRYQTIRIGRK